MKGENWLYETNPIHKQQQQQLTETMVVLLHLAPIPPPQTICRQFSSRVPCPTAFSRLQITHLNGVRIEAIKQRGVMVVKAAASADADTPSESKVESSSVEALPLELSSAKLELKLEQKMKMKLAKKIRLRRKRLVRKRQLRKKGRWPPSKMKKNKNV